MIFKETKLKIAYIIEIDPIEDDMEVLYQLYEFYHG